MPIKWPPELLLWLGLFLLVVKVCSDSQIFFNFSTRFECCVPLKHLFPAVSGGGTCALLLYSLIGCNGMSHRVFCFNEFIQKFSGWAALESRDFLWPSKTCDGHIWCILNLNLIQRVSCDPTSIKPRWVNILYIITCFVEALIATRPRFPSRLCFFTGVHCKLSAITRESSVSINGQWLSGGCHQFQLVATVS